MRSSLRRKMMRRKMKTGRKIMKIQKSDYCVLIPSKGRPDTLTMLFKRNPGLNNPDTYIGLELKEMSMYKDWYRDWGNQCTIVEVKNPTGMPGNAREALRKAAVWKGYTRYVSLDDDFLFSALNLDRLLFAQAMENCFMAARAQSELMLRDAIAQGTKYPYKDKYITTFEAYSTSCWVIPDFIYEEFQYPKDCFNDDVFLALWAITQRGFTTFRMCREATVKYSLKRFARGGGGAPADRIRKMALGMLQLAESYPEIAEPSWMKTSFSWRKIVEKYSQKEIENDTQK
jgi:hypothetical protein